MIDAEMVFHQIILGGHHVVVVVFRERRPQAVRRLAAAAGADRVGDDDEVLGGVERLAWPVERAGEPSVSMLLALPVVPCSISTGSPDGSPTVV